MNLNVVLQTTTSAPMRIGKHSIVSLLSQLCEPIAIPINPPNIVEFLDSGFRVHVGSMKPYVPYRIHFDNSEYFAWKDKNEALVLTEVA